MLDNRLLALLDEMIKMPVLSYWELGNLFEMPVTQVKKDIREIQTVLLNNQLTQLVLNENGYEIVGVIYEINQVVEQELQHSQMMLTEKERVYLVYLYTFSREEILSNFHYQYLLRVSKNTIISDIKKVNQEISAHQVSLKYSRSKGYHLVGDEVAKRKAAIYFVGELLNIPTGNWLLGYLLKNQSMSSTDLERLVTQEARQHELSLVSDRLENIVFFVSLLILRLKRVKENIDFSVNETPFSTGVMSLAEVLVKQIYPTGTRKSEMIYLTTLLLGVTEGSLKEVSQIFEQLTDQIIEKMETVAVLTFKNREQLFSNLYAHLVPTYYRLLFGNTIQNDLTEYIKYTHYALFELVKEALTPLEELVGAALPDDEISYFTVHFGGQIESQSEVTKKIKAMIICPNGISSSLILKKELQQLFPQFDWLENRSMYEVEQLAETSYDLVFSTVYVGTTKPLYIVKPLMDNLFRQYLLQKVSKDFHLVGYHHIEISDVLETIEQYATIHQRDKLEEELLIQLLPENKYEEVNLPVLNEVITAERIQIVENKDLDWEAAIRLSGAPLLAEKAILPDYMEAVINKVKELGAFIDLGSGIAIPHARPEEGVQHLGMSVLKLDKPVNLLDDPAHAISIFICIAAIDNHSHLKALSQLTKILMDTEKVTRLKMATKVEDILAVIKEGGEEDND